MPDLQQAIDQSYDIEPYSESLADVDPPSPPLAEDDDAWADQLLRIQGLRT